MNNYLTAFIVGNMYERANGDEPVVASEVVHGLMWDQFSRPTFRLTHGLVSGLILTDPGKVPMDTLRLPFPAFTITIPPGIVMYDDATRDGAAEGVVDATTITVVQFDDYSEEIGNEIERELKSHNGSLRSTFVSELAGRIQSGDGGAKNLIAILMYSPSFPSVKIGFRSSDAPLVEDAFDISEEKSGPRNAAAIEAGVRIAVNLIMYLQTHDDQERPVWTRSSRPNGRPSAVDKPTVWDIGHSVKLPQQVHAAARAFTAEADRKTWKLYARHVVRGHSQSYWYGSKSEPDSREKRRRWIAPYWHGPKDGQVIPRFYDVDW